MDQPKTNILIMFKNQMVSFIEQLIQQFPQEGDFVVLKLFVDTQVQIEKLVHGWIKQLDRNDGKVRKMITDRNDIFFIEENPFKFINDQRLLKFTTLWKTLEDDDKQSIWKWMDLFVKISDKYKPYLI
jgi:hypothetical protein